MAERLGHFVTNAGLDLKQPSIARGAQRSSQYFVISRMQGCRTSQSICLEGKRQTFRAALVRGVGRRSLAKATGRTKRDFWIIRGERGGAEVEQLVKRPLVGALPGKHLKNNTTRLQFFAQFFKKRATRRERPGRAPITDVHVHLEMRDAVKPGLSQTCHFLRKLPLRTAVPDQCKRFGNPLFPIAYEFVVLRSKDNLVFHVLFMNDRGELLEIDRF